MGAHSLSLVASRLTQLLASCMSIFSLVQDPSKGSKGTRVSMQQEREGSARIVACGVQAHTALGLVHELHVHQSWRV